MSRRPEPRRCGRCLHFVDDPAAFEQLFPGLLALSSGYGDCRGDQGVCRLHQQMLTPAMTCRRFSPREAVTAVPEGAGDVAGTS